jgi:hypothetical protein
MLIIPVLHPTLEHLDEIEMISERGIGSFGSSNESSRQGARIAVPELENIEISEMPFLFRR